MSTADALGGHLAFGSRIAGGEKRRQLFRRAVRAWKSQAKGARPYSYLSAWIGLARAIQTVWKITVTQATSSAANPAARK